MSGIEIAGLVLGGFPLLISAAEHYREGFEPLLKWKRFRTDFIGFIDAVDIERQLFDQMLEHFLISADVPHEELHLFMTNPNYEGWRREDLVSVLRHRLGTSYEVYMSTIRTMNKLMSDLQDILFLRDGEVDWADDSSSRWDFHLKRIRLSFSKRGPKTVSLLENHNRKLRELLESHDKLESMNSTRKDISWGGIFECIRRHANSMHSAIKRSWNCDCINLHVADLQLQHRSEGGWSSSFSITFQAFEEPQVLLGKCRVVIISVRELKYGETSTGGSLHSCGNKTPQRGGQSDLRKLRQNLQSTSTSRLNDAARPSLPPSLSELSSSSIRSAFRDRFSQIASLPRTEATDGLSITGTEPTLTNRNHGRPWLGKAKAKKTVRIDDPLPIEVLAQVREPTLPVTLESSNTHIATVLEIQNLCSHIWSTDHTSEILGFILDEAQRHHELRTSQRPVLSPEDISSISLQTILQNQKSCRLTRHQRYKLASVLASSMLQLQTTPWLTDKLEKKDILFYKKGTKVLFDYPFIRQSFVSNKNNQTSSESINRESAMGFTVRNSLSYLGIILLELCFGQAIEDQEFRTLYLSPDGTPNLGTDFMTARDWAEMVYEEAPDWEQIIKSCMFCNFEEKPNWDNKKFTQAVYVNVVEPLEKMTTKWSVS